MTDPDTGESGPSAPGRSQPRSRLHDVGFVAAVVAVYAVVGAGLGWLWFRLWTPEDGQVFDHRWYASGDALRGDFSGTGLYVLLAAGGGLALGLACGLLGGRRPLVATVSAVAGAVLAGWLMLRLGQSLGPADPATLAKTADDGTRLSSDLRVTGVTPRLAFGMGTLAGLAFLFTIFPGKSR